MRMSDCHPDRKHAALGFCKSCYLVHYWATNGEELHAKQKEFRTQNAEKCKARSKKYYENNRDYVKERSRNYYVANSQRVIARVFAHEKANPEKAKKWKRAYRNAALARRFGINEEELYRLRKSPCELCGTTKLVRLDHDHNTGRLRGVLCHGCNVAVGTLGDNPEGLLKAYQYLVKSDANN